MTKADPYWPGDPGPPTGRHFSSPTEHAFTSAVQVMFAGMRGPTEDQIILGDSLDVLATFEDESFRLIYSDPPFNTGKEQARVRIRTVADDAGDRTGFQGRRYKIHKLGRSGYADVFDDYLGFIEPHLLEAHRLLDPKGTFYFHIDYREAHYCKVAIDRVFGRDCYLNEIIWAYDSPGSHGQPLGSTSPVPTPLGLQMLTRLRRNKPASLSPGARSRRSRPSPRALRLATAGRRLLLCRRG